MRYAGRLLAGRPELPRRPSRKPGTARPLRRPAHAWIVLGGRVERAIALGNVEDARAGDTFAAEVVGEWEGGVALRARVARSGARLYGVLFAAKKVRHPLGETASQI